MITDAVALEAVDGRVVATKAIFGGAATTHSRVPDGTQLICLKPNAVAAEPAPSNLEIEGGSTPWCPTSRVASTSWNAWSRRPGGAEQGVDEADVVVSGGRGLGTVELPPRGGARGRVRRRCGRVPRRGGRGLGYPHQHQVGQTGKTVSPQVYIAVGISVDPASGRDADLARGRGDQQGRRRAAVPTLRPRCGRGPVHRGSRAHRGAPPPQGAIARERRPPGLRVRLRVAGAAGRCGGHGRASRALLAPAAGRAIEVGAGTGLNLPHYLRG